MMRRKSERTASKKTKASPEKKEKPEKPKKPKTRRRKQSASSDNESVEEVVPVPPAENKEVVENNPPQTSTKEDSPEEANEVWHVKAAEVSDVGEIQKLKICLTRPPTTPERVDRSPRSKRKHSRSASGEPSDERKKGKHRTRRAATEAKEGSEKNQDSQGDEPDSEKDSESKNMDEVSQSSSKQDSITDETPMSTTDDTKVSEETKPSEDTNSTTESSTNQEEEKNKTDNESETQEKPSDADTTVASPKPDTETDNTQDSSVANESESRKRTISEEKSEILELHADESRCESSYMGLNDTQIEDTNPESPNPSKVSNSETDVAASKVSITDDNVESGNNSEKINSTEITNVATNETNVVESSQSPEKEVMKSVSAESTKTPEVESSNEPKQCTSEPTPVSEERLVHNGQALTQSSRKRRWGSRPSRITTQKSITISTDVLKDIIPDVKPVEFDEVIEEKKHHKRIEVSEKLERPVLPKIVIDNTENVEVKRKGSEDRDKENIKIREPHMSSTRETHVSSTREPHMSSSRKISIVKQNESIIARPPSPPRHKQSNILFITNLVRPFTLPQLKNLLQRTGRIVENGFWIDRIKSKCFVQYETEDQAVETRHALHGVTWPVSNPKTLHVDFSTSDDFEKAKVNEETDNAKTSTIPGTVEDWLREQDLKRERGEMEKPWERKMNTREWDLGKNDKGKEKDKLQRPDDRLQDKRRHRTPERSPEPAKKFKKKEEEAPAKLLDDLFRKTKSTPCIYWLPLSAETIAVKEEQRRQHMAEHERRLQELRRTHRRH